MNRYALSSIAFILSLSTILFFAQPASAGSRLQDGQVERGKYLAAISGCTSCHTPLLDEYSNPQTLTLEQIRTLAFNDHDASNQAKLLAGGRVFDLGPAGKVFSKNITPDSATGIGTWSADDIKTAMTTGQEKSGDILFPVMPYHTYNSMAEADVDAIVSYVRSVQAVQNKVPPHTVSTQGLQALPAKPGIVAPDGTDPLARGAYLVNSVMGCTDCHTPLDPATGAPQMDKYLGGGQPYEGPWGIVYGGNITPDTKTGLGDWSEDEIKRALTHGLSRDGRRLILMPWYAYSQLTEADANAVAAYLKNGLPALSNSVPAAALNPDFVVIDPSVETRNGGGVTSNFWEQPISLVVAAAIVVLSITVGLALLRRKPRGQ